MLLRISVTATVRAGSTFIKITAITMVVSAILTQFETLQFSCGRWGERAEVLGCQGRFEWGDHSFDEAVEGRAHLRIRLVTCAQNPHSLYHLPPLFVRNADPRAFSHRGML